jgi:hypothetical protein
VGDIGGNLSVDYVREAIVELAGAAEARQNDRGTQAINEAAAAAFV